MGQTTIEWTATRHPDGRVTPGYSFNPVRGCTKVSDGCKFCYAETLSKRNPAVLGEWGPNGTRTIAAESYWRLPLQWDREAAKAGERRRVFCASLSDVFEDRPEWVGPRERLFNLANDTEHLDWLFLTKRPENIERLLSQAKHRLHRDEDFWGIQSRSPRPNWWFGTSCENQETAEERVLALLRVPAVVHWISAEPLLGPIALCKLRYTHGYVDALRAERTIARLTVHSPNRIRWVVAGGESGAQARPARPDWFRQLRDDCRAAGCAFFYKQTGEWAPAGEPQTDPGFAGGAYLDDPTGGKTAVKAFSERGTRYRLAHETYFVKSGKKTAGRLLDGIEHNAYPEVNDATR